jgi:hypothetical protein
MTESSARPLSDREALVLSKAVDGLLPGGEGFPRASQVDTPASMVAELDADALEEWLRPGLAALDNLAGGDFVAVDEQARVGALRRAQDEYGPFFDRLIDLSYYSYYAQPPVIAVVRSLCSQYNDTPQPRGYNMDPFDANNPEMLPARPHGYYKKTDDVEREVAR